MTLQSTRLKMHAIFEDKMLKRMNWFLTAVVWTYNEGENHHYLTHFASKIVSDKEISPREKYWILSYNPYVFSVGLYERVTEKEKGDWKDEKEINYRVDNSDNGSLRLFGCVW